MKCSECGACCESFSLPVVEAIPITNDPRQQDLNRWFRLHASDDGERLTFECKCTMLTRKGLCAIYDRRPDVCRNFQRGGPECLATIKERRTPEDYQRIRDKDDPETLV